MNRIKFILFIVLLIMVSSSVAVAGELKIYSIEGVQTLNSPDSESLKATEEQERKEGYKYDNYRRVDEKSVQNSGGKLPFPNVKRLKYGKEGQDRRKWNPPKRKNGQCRNR